MADTRSPAGAYGLILDRDVEATLLVPAPASWVPWRLDAARSDTRPAPEADDFHVTGGFARLPLVGGGWAEIDRAGQRTVLFVDHVLTRHERAHPAPATTGGMVAWWSGRQALHGSAVCTGNRAIALLGTRQHGKSTTSMRLLERGFDLVADDLLVVDGATVLAGPRSLDLREEAARQLGVGVPLGVVGSRERWRVVLPPPSSSVCDLVGLVELEWGDTLEVTPLTIRERFEALTKHRTMPMLPPLDPQAVLGTLGVPFVRLTRPRDLAALDPAIDALLTALDVSPRADSGTRRLGEAEGSADGSPSPAKPHGA